MGSQAGASERSGRVILEKCGASEQGGYCRSPGERMGAWVGAWRLWGGVVSLVRGPRCPGSWSAAEPVSREKTRHFLSPVAEMGVPVILAVRGRAHTWSSWPHSFFIPAAGSLSIGRPHAAPHFLAASVTELTPCPSLTLYSLHPDRPTPAPSPRHVPPHGGSLPPSFFVSSWLQCVPDSSPSAQLPHTALVKSAWGSPSPQHHL